MSHRGYYCHLSLKQATILGSNLPKTQEMMRLSVPKSKLRKKRNKWNYLLSMSLRRESIMPWSAREKRMTKVKQTISLYAIATPKTNHQLPSHRPLLCKTCLLRVVTSWLMTVHLPTKAWLKTTRSRRPHLQWCQNLTSDLSLTLRKRMRWTEIEIRASLCRATVRGRLTTMNLIRFKWCQSIKNNNALSNNM